MVGGRSSTAIASARAHFPAWAAYLSAALAAAPLVGCHGNKASAAQPLPNTAAPFATPPILTGTPDVAALVARVKPAVVNITSIHTERLRTGSLDLPSFPDLRWFFGFHEGRPGERGPGGNEGGGEEILRQQALGSGFIIDDKGHVVTNAHVVDEASTVKVKLADDREFRAKVIGRDERLDVAVIELQAAPHDLPIASLGSSDVLRVGEYVVAIGNPFGLGDTVTMGIVSAKDRSLGAGPYDDYIQTDASINPGNSGGPLFDLRGQVVGINAAINPQGKGIGFAIPIDAVKRELPQLITKGHVSRGQLGVEIQGVDQDLANALGLDRARGALVERVEPGSPAASAGIHEGDVITAVDGRPITTFEDVPRLIAPLGPGTQVKLSVVTNRKSHDVEVKLAPLQAVNEPEWRPEADGSDHGVPSPTIGASVADADGRAVVTGVSPEGPSEGKLRPGDVVEEVNGKKTDTASEVRDAVAKAASDRPVLLRVRRGEHSLYLAVPRQAQR